MRDLCPRDASGCSALLFHHEKNSRAGGWEFKDCASGRSHAALWEGRTGRQQTVTAALSMLMERSKGTGAVAVGGGFRTLVIVAQNNG
jgi:hypothetical protein